MRPGTLLTALLMVTVVFASCEFQCSVGKDNTAEEKNKPKKKGESLLYNGIQVSDSLVKVKKAYLVTNDAKGERIGEDNFIDLKKGVKLLLLVENNWVASGDRVWLGASMIVTTEDGEKVLEEQDMFAPYEADGLPAKDANIIGLSVTFKEKNTRQPLSFDVRFRVWDKRGAGVIEGSYTIHTR